MDDLRNRQVRKSQGPKASVRPWSPLQTADGSHGMSNLQTVPRAGNISSDTRAGTSARSGAEAHPRSLATVAQSYVRPTLDAWVS